MCYLVLEKMRGKLSMGGCPARWPRTGGPDPGRAFRTSSTIAGPTHPWPTQTPRARFARLGRLGRVGASVAERCEKSSPGRPRLRLRASHRPVVAGSRVEGWSGRGVLGPKSWQNFPSGAQSAHWDRGDLCGATGSYPIHWSELRSKNEQACSISKMADFRDG